MSSQEKQGKSFFQKLTTVSVLFLIDQTVGTIIAVIKKLPFEIGGDQGDPNNIVQDFVFGNGTALSAPLIPLLILFLFLWLARRQDGWGTLGLGGTALLGIVFTVGASMEPIVWRMFGASPFGLFEAVVIVQGLGSIILTVLMLLFGIRTLIERRKAKGSYSDHNLQIDEHT